MRLEPVTTATARPPGTTSAQTGADQKQFETIFLAACRPRLPAHRNRLALRLAPQRFVMIGRPASRPERRLQSQRFVVIPFETASPKRRADPERLVVIP